MFLTSFTSVSYFFFLYQSLSLSLYRIFHYISSNTDEVLSINPSANVFVFADFNDHHRDQLTYSDGTDRPGELCYIFSISNNLTLMVNFPTWIHDCDSHSPALLDLILSSDASICSTMAFPLLRNSDHVVISVSINFPSKWGALFHHVAQNYSYGDWGSLCDPLRDVPCEHIFKLTASASASEFYNRVQVGINVCIPHCKYCIKLHSSSWFLAACTAVIVHRNHFFCLYQQNISSESKGDIRQASNCCKRVLEAAKLACANETKSPSLPRNLDLRTLGKLLIVFSTKVNLLKLLYSTTKRCCLLQ